MGTVKLPKPPKNRLAPKNGDGLVDFQVKDLALADWGRKTIQVAEQEMPGLISIRRKYAPGKPDGQKLFDEALAKAKTEGKKVLFDESGPYCGPCYQFSEYLEANKELIEREYVCVTMDYRFSGAKEIFERLKAATSTPWIAILDADRKVLATSDGPDGNVGFEKPQWEKMVRATAAKLKAEEVATLLKNVKE